MRVFGDVAEVYEEFAAGCDSETFRDWAGRVAHDPDVLAWLAALPGDRERQPNLVLAAARWHGVPAPGSYDVLRAALLADDGPIRATIAARRTQTNEAGRLATLTPVLSWLAATHDEPLALLEVGASAGLCLFPDRWDYTWRTPEGVVRTDRGAPGRLDCVVTGAAPPAAVWPSRPDAVVPVAWRGGLDLAPVDVTDEDQVAWLRTLVWPEHHDRRERLDTAVGLARAEPPDVRRGDVVADPQLLDDLVTEAGRHGRVVLLHSAVTAYLEDADRAGFERQVRGLVADGRCHWLCHEGARVHPSVTATAPSEPGPAGDFVLGLDGRAVARTHGHGRSMRWFEGAGDALRRSGPAR